MSEQINWAERRQFGRRPLNASAVAELPGQVEVPCIIENLSEGGALLSFPTGVAPISRFELVVEGFAFRLSCEMRYQVGIRFGVSFDDRPRGEALVRYFFPSASEPAHIETLARKLCERGPVSSRSVRQLREAVLALIGPDAGAQAQAPAQPGDDAAPAAGSASTAARG